MFTLLSLIRFNFESLEQKENLFQVSIKKAVNKVPKVMCLQTGCHTPTVVERQIVSRLQMLQQIEILFGSDSCKLN